MTKIIYENFMKEFLLDKRTFSMDSLMSRSKMKYNTKML